MATKDLGSKHLCASCGAKFYDLGKQPPTCPKCETVAEVVVKPKPTRAAAKPPKETPAKPPEAEEDTAVEADDDDGDDAPLAAEDDDLDDDKDDVNALIGDADRKE